MHLFVGYCIYDFGVDPYFGILNLRVKMYSTLKIYG